MAYRNLDEQNELNKKNEQVFIDAGVPYQNVTDNRGQTYQTWGGEFFTPTAGGATNPGYFETYGHIGSDSMGGMFDKQGYSNTDNYLQNTIGLSREQINQSPFLAGLSDVAIQTAYNQTQPWATDLWYDPNRDGFNVSNAYTDGAISIDQIQQELAKVAGWTPYQQSTFAPVIGPTGYNAANAALANSSGGAYGSSGVYPGGTAGGGMSSSLSISSPGVGGYNSPYAKQIADLLAQIQGRGEFKYDFNADPIYQQYKDRYTQAGKMANMDAQANAAALTGGYGNSWSQTVGQQQEQQYLHKLNDIIPDLHEYNYGIWSDQNDWLMDQLGLYQDLDDTEYKRFLDQREWDYMMQQAALAAMDGGGYGGGSGGSYNYTGSIPSTDKKRSSDDDSPKYNVNPGVEERKAQAAQNNLIDEIVAGVWDNRSSALTSNGTHNLRVVQNEVNDIMRANGITDEASQQYAVNQIKQLNNYFTSINSREVRENSSKTKGSKA